MALMFDFLIADILAASLVTALAIITYYNCIFNYWKKRGVPQVIPPKIPFGTLPKIFPPDDYFGKHIKLAYDLGKRQGFKHAAYFWCSAPKYIPVDLEYIKNILQRDFSYFTERGFYYNERDDPLSANLFAIGGEKWRIIRTKLSPSFTSGKLKMMFDSLLQCGNQMQDEMERICLNKKVVNMKDISECFTIDVIGSCAFGLDCNCFKNPDAEFKKQGRQIFAFNQLRVLKVLFSFNYPDFARWLGIRLFDDESTGFFVNLVKNSLKYRQINNVTRKDFLQLLFELKKESEETHEDESRKGCFTIEELTAQAFIFFAAGFETSSITLTFCLYELSINQDIQNTLREEVNRVLLNYDGKISYDAIADMKYMNQVVEETLRKYPPVSWITRVAVKDYQMPGTETVIEKGIEVMISILGLHHDPEYYPDPEKFDPERFSEKNKQGRVPFTYMPFGEGPRICIGLRFGLMQVKVGLAILLQKYQFYLNEKTANPLRMERFSFTLTPQEDIFLDVEKITR